MSRPQLLAALLAALLVLAALATPLLWLLRHRAADLELVRPDSAEGIVLALPHLGELRHASFAVVVRCARALPAGTRMRVLQGHVRAGGELLADDVLRYRLPDWQTADPAGEGYFSVTGAAYPLRVTTVPGKEGSSSVITSDREIPSGTELLLHFGDTTLGGAGQRVPPEPLAESLIIAVETPRGTTWIAVPLEIRATRVERLAVVNEATPSAPHMRLEIHAMQGGGGEDAEAPVPDASGSVALALADGSSVEPPQVVLDHGRWSGTVSVPSTRGTIVATLAGTSVSGRGNPFVRRAPQDPQLLFGSLHAHSAIGGHGAGTPEQAFAYARDVAALDFFALTEHAGTPHFHWRELRELPDRYQVPDGLVTFAGYEWSPREGGHRHVILREGKRSIACCPGGADEEGERNALALVDFLGASGPGHDPNALVICHHTALRTGERDAYDWGDGCAAPRQTLVEWFSWHGSSFAPVPGVPLDGREDHTLPPGQGSYALERLRAGHRIGLVADGDQHFARPGSPIGVQRESGERYPRHGLTAVWAAERSRSGIFAALEEHRCYGTTGARILLRFSAGSAPMGSVLEADGPVELALEACGTARITRVTVLGAGPEPLATFAPGTVEFAARIPVAPRAGESAFYVAEVEQEDGHQAISSPIFVTPAAGAR